MRGGIELPGSPSRFSSLVVHPPPPTLGVRPTEAWSSRLRN